MFRRHWLLFEVDPGTGGGEGGGGEPAVESPAAEAPAEGEGEGEGEGSGEGQPEYVTRDDLAQLTEGLGPLLELARDLPPQGFEQPYGQQPQGQEPLQMPDPYTSDNFAAEMQAYLEQRDQQLLQRFAPIEEHTYLSQAEQQIQQGLASVPEEIMGALGDEHADQLREAITIFSAGFLPPGSDPAVVPEVMQQTGTYLNGLLEAAKAQGRAEYIASLQGGGEGGDHVTEPGVGGGGVEGVPEATSYSDIVNRNLAALGNG